MRDYLFRGFYPSKNGSKAIIVNGEKIKGKWLFGNYVKYKETYIFPELGSDWLDNYEVLPETVGQYTGLEDKNGKKVFEGDRVSCTHWFFDGAEIEENFNAVVGFSNGSFTLEQIKSKYYQDYTGYNECEGICWIGEINFYHEDYEIIGNIYENPELEEKGNER